eukprot:1458871-Pleurochrysis_carterae.AAC.1
MVLQGQLQTRRGRCAGLVCPSATSLHNPYLLLSPLTCFKTSDVFGKQPPTLVLSAVRDPNHLST